jgi:hypothetical protein
MQNGAGFDDVFTRPNEHEEHFFRLSATGFRTFYPPEASARIF